MYAIIEQGSKQHKVEVDREILVEKIDGKPGDKVEFDKVIFLRGKSETVAEDSARLRQAKVKATIVEQTKDKKIIVFKYKPKKNYRRKTGHRQCLTRLKIDEIIGLKEEKAEAKKTEVKKETPKETAKKTVKSVASKEAPKKPVPKKPTAKK